MAHKPTPPEFKVSEEQLALLEKLSNACAVSGDESEVRKIIMEELKDIADDLAVDALGNLLVTRKGKGRKRMKVMVAAHMDEVGMMIVDDEKEGIFRFDVVGGIDERQLVGKSVVVGKDHLPGVIGAIPIHLEKDLNRKIPLDSLRIDLGPGGGEKAKPGDRATFGTKFKQVGPSLFGKALDDRLGVATLIGLVKNPPDNVDLLAAFTVQEEVGLRGARVAAYTLDPDVGIAVDATPCMDYPSWDEEENSMYNTRLDHGPALYVADSATIADPRLLRHFVERTGVPSISISVPLRNAHTAVGVARISDWQNLVALVHAGISRLKPEVLERK